MSATALTSDGLNFGLTTCAHCNELRHRDEVLAKEVPVGRSTIQEHFCNQTCFIEWNLDRQRCLGM